VSPIVDLDALFSLTYGLYVVTSCCGDKLNGQLSNSVFQVADEPPCVAICINKKALTHECISESAAFAVSVLRESTPMKFIGLFGFRSGREVDKLSRVEFKPGVSGCPLVTENAIALVEAKVIKHVELDSHTIFIGEVVSAERLGEGKPLTYAYYREQMRGKTPENAPTHRREEDEEMTKHGVEGASGEPGEEMRKYVCEVCGWVYDPELGDPDGGIEPGTPFKDLPEDWVCPICGVGKERFEVVR